MITRYDLDRIKKRWKDEKKISGKDVEELLRAADSALTMKSANDARNAARGAAGRLGGLFGDFGL